MKRGKTLKPARIAKNIHWPVALKAQAVALYKLKFSANKGQGFEACAVELKSNVPGFEAVVGPLVRAWVSAKHKLDNTTPNKFGLLFFSQGRPPVLTEAKEELLITFLKQLVATKSFRVTAASLRPLVLAWLHVNMPPGCMKPGQGNFRASDWWLTRLARKAQLVFRKPYGNSRKAPANAEELIEDLRKELAPSQSVTCSQLRPNRYPLPVDPRRIMNGEGGR